MSENEIMASEEVTAKVREAAAIPLGEDDLFREESDAQKIIVWADGRWCLPGLDSTWGTWSDSGCGKVDVFFDSFE